MKKILLAAVAACLFCATFSSRADVVDDSSRVIAYLFKVILSPAMLERMVTDKTAPNESELRALSMAALKDYDANEIAQLLASSPLNTITAEEVKPCLAFIGTPAARTLEAVGQRSQAIPEKLMQELQSLPMKEQNEMVAFFTTPCVQKVSAMLQTDQARSMSREYGEQLMCRHIAANLPEKLEVVHQMGKCL